MLDRVRIPKEAVGIEGSSLGLREGEILTVQELLYGLMLHSGNDAAVALAIYCGGTVEGFAELMNDKARVLGLKSTHFVNPHGLDAPEHYSTARDLATLGAYAMENPIFYKTVSAKQMKIGERYLRNHNKLLWQLEGADGIKTGYTRSAGRLLVSSARRNRRRLIAVTINAPSDWADHKYLLEEGFSGFEVKNLVQPGDVLGTAQIAGGQEGNVDLLAGEEFSYPLRAGEKPLIQISGPGFVYAPVVEGADAGIAHITLDGTEIGEIPLIFGKTVEKIPEEPRSFWNKLFGRE